MFISINDTNMLFYLLLLFFFCYKKEELLNTRVTRVKMLIYIINIDRYIDYLDYDNSAFYY
jgi:hypothetical protein